MKIRLSSLKLFIIFVLLTALLSLHVTLFIINGHYAGSGIVSNLDAVFGSQLIVLLGMGSMGLLYGLAKDHSVLKSSLILICALSVLIIPATIIYQTNYYWRGGEGGPSGADFDCILWDNGPGGGNAYSDLLSEPECTLLHVPLLNAALIDPETSYSIQPTRYYFLTLAVSETVIISGVLLARRQLDRSGTRLINKTT